jgi:hypothetical protein
MGESFWPIGSHERSEEVTSSVLPPTSTTLVSLNAPHVVKQSNEIRIASFYSTPDEVFSSVHRVIQAFEELTASVPIESVDFGNDPHSSWVIGDLPPQQRSTHIIVNRNTHSGKLGEVVKRTAWCGKVKVE